MRERSMTAPVAERSQHVSLLLATGLTDELPRIPGVRDPTAQVLTAAGVASAIAINRWLLERKLTHVTARNQSTQAAIGAHPRGNHLNRDLPACHSRVLRDRPVCRQLELRKAARIPPLA